MKAKTNRLGLEELRTSELKKKLVISAVIAVAVIAVVVWIALKPSDPGAGLVNGKDRIENTESSQIDH